MGLGNFRARGRRSIDEWNFDAYVQAVKAIIAQTHSSRYNKSRLNWECVSNLVAKCSLNNEIAGEFKKCIGVYEFQNYVFQQKSDISIQS